MSSPNTTPKHTPRRTTSKRSPLQERSASQKNEAAGRHRRDTKEGLFDAEFFITTPFPTKPQHVLLPSTIRKQRSRQNVENELPSVFYSSVQPNGSSAGLRSQPRQDERRVRKAPKIQLKKSVTALRDMYEAQAESSRPSTAVRSRPSTAAPSPALRPTSSRMRSISSSEGLSGRSAWEMLGLPKVSAEDLATLPTLLESVTQQLDSEQSFASRVRNHGVSSSPNFRTFGTSSPKFLTFHDMVTSSDPIDGSSSSGLVENFASSPNFVQLQQDTSLISTDPTPPFEEEEEEEAQARDSSPNLVKLGSSSPKRSTSPTPSEASTSSRKRKRPEVEGQAYAGRTPLFFGTRRNRQPVSPTVQNQPPSSDASLQSSSQRVMPSSPPSMESARSRSLPTSSPVIRLHPGKPNRDRSSLVSAHTNLQSVLSSSPAPITQRPIVRTPDVNQFEIMSMQKRDISDPSRLEHNAIAKSSPAASVTNIQVQQLSSTDLSQFQPRRSSRVSAFDEGLSDDLDTESIAPVQAYMVQHDLNSSQVNMISDADLHEAADELSALRAHTSFAAALSQARSVSLLGTSSSGNSLSQLESLRTSLDDRLQSMRSYSNGRADSLQSSYRPGSSGSYMSANVVPTWARRYYSGLYRNSFQYLYQSSSNLTYQVTHLPPPPPRPVSVPNSISVSSSFENISTSPNTRRSLSRSVRSSLRTIIPSIVRPAHRPRLNVRQSHTTVGIGPLVSNPVRPRSEMIPRPPSAYSNKRSIRRVSAPLLSADPRYHWNGLEEGSETTEEAERAHESAYTSIPKYVNTSGQRALSRPSYQQLSPPRRLSRLPTPHLHHDRKLHTGSSASHGFGAPYNTRPGWQPSSGRIDDVGPLSWLTADLRDAQVICFLSGFLLPLTWFIGAFLPLPKRPVAYYDIEKAERALCQGQEADLPAPADWSEGDVVARLRLEKHLRGLEEVKWQNARWWRRMNRWMCCVGLVVLAVVIALAVIGTKSHWS